MRAVTRTGFAVVRMVAEGVVRLACPGYFEQTWTRKVARKATFCAATGGPIGPGVEVYAPLTNGKNRGQRVLASWAEG